MPSHIAIIQSPYDELILRGEKTIECRLTKVACPPFGCVVPGERLYIKRSGGPFVATAIAARVFYEDRLTPRRVEAIRKQFDEKICGKASFWSGKARQARFATLIWLRDVQPWSQPPRYRPIHMRAWYVLADHDALGDIPARDVKKPPLSIILTITGGSLRQGYLRLGTAIDQFDPACLGGSNRAEAGALLTIETEAGPEIETDIVQGKRMFRAMRFRPIFEKMQLQADDKVTLTRISRRRWRLSKAAKETM